MHARRHPGAHPRDAGRPFRLIVRRDGKRVVLGPLRAKSSDGAYRIGIAIESRTGPGESPPAAARDAVQSDLEHHGRDGPRYRPSRDRPRHESGLELRRDRARLGARPGGRACATSCSCSALVSLALGLLNLLPVLPLDGGHIVMALVEKVRGRTFRQAVYVRYSVFGLTLFAVLMYFGLRNDLFGGGG